MEKNKILVNGKLIKAGSQLSFKDRKQISSITEYLVHNHGYQILQPYYAQNLDSVMKQDSLDRGRYSYGKVNKLLGLLNIKYMGQYERDETVSNSFNYSMAGNKSTGIIKVEGFDYLIDNYNCYNQDGRKDKMFTFYKFEKDSLTTCFDPQKNVLSIAANSDTAIVFELETMLKKIGEKNGMESRQLKESEMTVSGSDKKYVYQLMIRGINGTQKDNHLQITGMQAMILIGRRK